MSEPAPDAPPARAPAGKRGRDFLARVNGTDIVGGLALMVIGVFFSVNAFSLGVGTGRSMGPGYFPLLAGALTILTSVFIIVPALFSRRRPESQPDLAPPAWRPFWIVMISIAVFIFTMPRFGLLPAIVALTIVAAVADRRSRPLSTILLAVGLCIGAWLIFVLGLGLPIRPYRWPY